MSEDDVAEGPMGVKPELAFDVCWEVYRGAREVLETKRGVSALNWEETTKFLWKPDIRARLNEYVADFGLAGKAALDGPDWASRMVLFRLYYLGLAPYDNARHFLGLSERSWVAWSEEVRQRCGKELLCRGMFPPRKYFRDRSEAPPRKKIAGNRLSRSRSKPGVAAVTQN
jgi:hypothetical protein